MKDLKLFDNYSQYAEKESKLVFPNVASTSDNDMVFFKASYILTKNIVDVRFLSSGGEEGNVSEASVLTLDDETVSSSAFSRRNENSKTFEEYFASKPMLMDASGEKQYIDNYNYYTEGSVDVDVYSNWYCQCVESSDDNLWITKPFNHAKIVFPQSVNPNDVYLCFGWEDQYGSMPTTYDSENLCENCKETRWYDWYPSLSEIIENGYARSEDNITFEFIDYSEIESTTISNIDFLGDFISLILNDYGYEKTFIACKYEHYKEDVGITVYGSLPFSLIIDDVYTINYNWRDKHYTSLQVLGTGLDGSYPSFDLSQVSQININGERMPYVDYGYNVPIIYNMFDRINGNYLVELEIKFYTKAINMTGMFCGITSLKEIDFGSFISPKITSLSQMFMMCSNLEKIHNLDKLDTSELRQMGNMFAFCSNIQSIDLTSFDTRKVNITQELDGIFGIFNYCNKLLEVKFGENCTFENGERLYYVFDNCTNLPTVDMSVWNTRYTWDWYYTFSNSPNLSEIIMMGDVSNINSGGYAFDNIAPIGTLIYNKQYEEAYQYFLQGMGQDGQFEGWYIMSSEDIYTAFSIIDNGTEISEGVVTINGIECFYDSSYNTWFNDEPLSLAKEYIVSLNNIEIGSFNNINVNKKYIFIGENISSYECFNITETIEVSDTDKLIKLINGAYQPYIGAILIDDKEVIYDIYHKFDTVGEHTIKILIDTTGIPLFFMDRMFYNCNEIKSITIHDNIDTSMLWTCNEMFLMEDYNMYTNPILTSITMLCDVSSIEGMDDMFYGLPQNGVFKYNCLYTEQYQYIIENGYLPETWTIDTCQTSEVNCKFIFIENGIELSEGNFTVNGVQCVYNTTDNVWEVTYEADAATSIILRGEEEIGLSNHKELQYILIGDNNKSYFNVIETLNVTSTTESCYLMYNNSMVDYIVHMFVDNVEITPTLNYTFETLGEHTVKMFIDTSNVTSMYEMFSNCNNLTSLDLSSFNTSNVTYMGFMFANCYDLISINFGDNFDTSKVTGMDGMFSRSSGLTSLDLSSFDTSNVTHMGWMFSHCNNLTSLDLSSFNTSAVTSMDGMFYDCWNLTSLDLSSFDTSNVYDMYDMFNGCNSLTSLDLSSFDTSKVTNMREMFYYCESLTSLDLRGWDLSNLKYGDCAFYGVGSNTNKTLEEIVIGDINPNDSIFECDE